MKPDKQSTDLLSITRSRAKMYEYSVPTEYHIEITKDPAKLLSLTIGILGDYANRKLDNEEHEEKQNGILFSAQYFDSFMESKLNGDISPYLLLLGSASYYLCNLPGSSLVLISKIGKSCPSLNCDGLENLLFDLLTNSQTRLTIKSENYELQINDMLDSLGKYYSAGKSEKNVLDRAEELCELAYKFGSNRELLISDVIKAVVKKRIKNSSRYNLAKYTSLGIQKWDRTLRKNGFVREFWPSQRLLGEKEVFNGKSAIVQMPTSAGKTKSIEIIIRSSFLSLRSNLAVIVAPFRALCTEIKNSLTEAFTGEKIEVDSPSDTFQMDFGEIGAMKSESSKIVLIATPEKLIYMLRHTPELAEKIGLVIYDEGHQFDSGSRGVTYELLISSLNRLIPKNIQTILISAVISNAEEIGNWLNGSEGEIIYGTNLLPTYRTVAFVSWTTTLGRLDFVDQLDPEKHDYFVPRVLEQADLKKRGRETITRKFPDKSDGKSIALYLGIKVVQNGCVAIFCGSKATVLNLCEKTVDLKSRSYPVQFPFFHSDRQEVERLTFLHDKHFGPDYTLTQSSSLGVFAHSANTPQGIRYAIEYAAQKGLIKFVICTSTLAQGVNLPIKYLIVTSIYQAGERIRTRDFHNLIGRAGRSGMHTEGTIIFADADVYDKKRSFKERWRWDEVKSLLNVKKSEPCVSTLLSIFDPLYSDDRKYKVSISPLEFVREYLAGGDLLSESEIFASANASQGFSKSYLSQQILNKINIISSIESYLMAYWEEADSLVGDDEVEILAKGTLAYFLSDESKRTEIIELFSILSRHVRSTFNNIAKRKSYGKTLFGVKDLVSIEKWTLEHLEKLSKSENTSELLSSIWPIVEIGTNNTTFQKISPKNTMLTLALNWIKGTSYYELFMQFKALNPMSSAGTQSRKVKQETVIELCDNAFSFDATLIIAAVREVIAFLSLEENEELIGQLNTLQKQVKYGLPDSLAIAFYEIGFSDRVISMELRSRFFYFSDQKKEIVSDIKENEGEIAKLLGKYPAYYINVLREISNK